MSQIEVTIFFLTYDNVFNGISGTCFDKTAAVFGWVVLDAKGNMKVNLEFATSKWGEKGFKKCSIKNFDFFALINGATMILLKSSKALITTALSAGYGLTVGGHAGFPHEVARS